MFGNVGLAAGGVWGLRDGFFRQVYTSKSALGALSAQQAAVPNATATGTGEAAAATTAATGQPQPLRLGTPLRLRLNTVLNAVTSRGTFVGNNAGVLGLRPWTQQQYFMLTMIFSPYL